MSPSESARVRTYRNLDEISTRAKCIVEALGQMPPLEQTDEDRYALTVAQNALLYATVAMNGLSKYAPKLDDLDEL